MQITEQQIRTRREILRNCRILGIAPDCIIKNRKLRTRFLNPNRLFLRYGIRIHGAQALNHLETAFRLKSLCNILLIGKEHILIFFMKIFPSIRHCNDSDLNLLHILLSIFYLISAVPS